jgi:hypothetical protein
MEGQTVVIDGLATGKIEADATHAKLPGESIAKIADDIVNKRIIGNVMGWYHSHIKGGVFMSDTDIETQLKLQQFSPVITALVIDAETGDVGFFRADPKMKKSIAIPQERVRIYGAGESPVPPAHETSVPPATKPFPVKTIIGALLLVALLVTAGIVAIFSYSYRPAESIEKPLAISHKPIARGIVGNSIIIDANVTGGINGLRNVTLRYALVSEAEAAWQTARMLLVSPEGITYSCTIPGSVVTGDLDYYIMAYDNAGNVAKTETYRILVADFDFVSDIPSITVIRGKTASTQAVISSINGFDKTVAISVVDRPPDITISYTPSSPRVPKDGSVTVSISVKPSPDAGLGESTMKVQATYTVMGTIQIIRSKLLTVLVTDFDVDVTPTTASVARGNTYSYTVTLTIHDGWVDPITLAVTGLPQTVTYEIIVTDNRFNPRGAVTLTLRITVTTDTPTGIYNLTLTATGAQTTHSKNFSLTVT